MIPHPFSTLSAKPAAAQARATALNAATTLRDCSFRRQSTVGEREACRTLMREQALLWRNPGAPPTHFNRAAA